MTRDLHNMKGPRTVLNNMMNKSQEIVNSVKSHPVTAELMARQQLAFSLLDPQVRVVKNSLTVQIVAGTVIAGSIFTGHLPLAAGVTAAWLGSTPLTHLVAGGVACVGEIDAALATAIAQLQAMAAEPADATAPQAEGSAS